MSGVVERFFAYDVHGDIALWDGPEVGARGVWHRWNNEWEQMVKLTDAEGNLMATREVEDEQT